MSFSLSIENNSEPSLNRYALLQSASDDVQETYMEVLAPVSGSYTIVADNDAGSKFRVAFAQLSPNAEQCIGLQMLATVIRNLNLSDPKRMNFTIAQAIDDEIYLRRTSSLGISKLILDEDGSITHSFIGLNGSTRKDVFDFIEEPQEGDWEGLAYKFFQY